jgi:hypothetical protein
MWKRAITAGLFAVLLGACEPEPLPLLMESLPLDLDAIDYDVVMAEHARYAVLHTYPISDFGVAVAGTSASPEGGHQLQPTFWAPLGTDVLAPVSGRVTGVPTLYSGDQSVMFEGDDGLIWETEHVIDVMVSEGDEVVAGQPVAKVGDYECEYARRMFGNDELCGTGIGIVELGLLEGRPDGPVHHCPFAPDRLAPDSARAIFDELARARVVIEGALSDLSYFDQDAWASEACVSLAPIEG